jgi:hypothetical protein
MFKVWIESTYKQLYDSSVRAFPDTKARQHLIHTIDINNVLFTPFLGVKTLLARGHAVNNENGNHYTPIILFKNVNYSPTKNIIEITAHADRKKYRFEQMKLRGNHILLRCGCLDHAFRFNYYCHLDHSLYGRKRAPYIGQGLWEANPMKLPGACKHLMSLAKELTSQGVIF